MPLAEATPQQIIAGKSLSVWSSAHAIFSSQHHQQADALCNQKFLLTNREIINMTHCPTFGLFFFFLIMGWLQEF